MFRLRPATYHSDATSSPRRRRTGPAAEGSTGGEIIACSLWWPTRADDGDGDDEMPDSVACGPIDFVLLEFPDDADTKACADAMMNLIERGVIRLFDVLVIRKALDGSYSGVDLTDVTPAGVGGFTAFEGARSGLIDNDDVSAAVAAMQPGTMAALIVFENAWAAPLVAAVLDAGGELIASQRIPAPNILEALERLEATQNV